VTPGEVAGRLERLTGAGVRDLRAAGSAHRWRYYRAVLADGREAFAKVAAAGLAGVFGAEAHGLRWLGEAGAVPVPEVLGWDEATLIVSWVVAGPAGPATAERFGRDLARLHAAGAPRFGAPWPGFIASLSMPNDDSSALAAAPGEPPSGPEPSWPDWYTGHRVLPYLRIAVDAGTLSGADARLVESAAARAGSVAGPAEPPSRIHGDCWSGNVLWSGGAGWLIDPAAHGGHRETDLAMLALFGAPYLDRILAAYQAETPLAAGWPQRVPLHQLHPLLVHVCLFGAAYRDAVLGAARAVLAA
jgi:fructosamine-3-kinase